MSKKVILGIVIIGILVLLGVIAALRILLEKEVDVAQIDQYVDSILPWDTVVAEIPKLAGY